MKNINEQLKEYIRVMLVNSKDGQFITFKREEKEYESTIESCGYEDLNMQKDQGKLNLYNSVEFISLNNKTYKVVKREWMPYIPVSLYLYLEEV